MRSEGGTLRVEHPSWGEGKLLRIEGTDWIVLFEHFGRSLRFPVEARAQLKILRAQPIAYDKEKGTLAETETAQRSAPSIVAQSTNTRPTHSSQQIDIATRASAFPTSVEADPVVASNPTQSPPANTSRPLAPTSQSQNGKHATDWRVARRTIESLSVGLPPVSQFARILAINFESTERLIKNVLNDVNEEGGAATIIKGEYGQGKTFALRCLEEISLESGYLVARTEIDALENRLNRPHSVYRDLMRHLRVPGENDIGVEPLIRRVMSVIEAELPHASNAERYHWLDEQLGCPSLAWLFSDRALLQKPLLIGLLAADPAVRTVQARYTHWSQISPQLWPVFNSSTQGDFACFLLSGIGRLARMLGLKGFIVILDEMEKWQDLHWREQTKAGNFLGGLIWGATTAGRRTRRAKYSGGLEHSKVCGGYPFTTKERNHVGVAIAMTPRSEEDDPERIWCQYGGPILDVNLPRLNFVKLAAYCERVAPIFSEAFSTSVPSRDALETISQDAIQIWKTHGEMNMRSAVQSAIAAFHNWRDHRELTR